MYSKLWGIFVGSSLLIGIAFASGPLAFAQFKMSAVAEAETRTSSTESEETPEFQVRESIHLGFGGFESHTSFGMIDENGFQHDTMNLFLHSNQAREDLGLSQEQYKEMWGISQERTRKLKSMVTAMIVGSKERSEIEEEFRDFESRINSVLEPEQLEQLELVKAQSAIRQHGLAKYLGMETMREKFGVSSDEVKQLEKSLKAADKEASEARELLLRSANEELIKKLSGSEQEALKSGMGEKGTEEFLNSPMFAGTQSADKKPSRKFSDPLRVLKLKSLAAKLKISAEQLEELKSLGEDLPSASKRDRIKVHQQLADILNSKQMVGVNRYIADRQLKRSGTVFTLTQGFLPDVVGLEEEQADELFEEGVKIYKELQSKINEDRKKAALAVLEEMSLERRGDLDAILGGSIFR